MSRARTDPRARPGAAARGSRPAATAPAAHRAALAIGAALAALALARAALAFAPGMGAWGANVHRHLDPLTAWLPWALAALALVPALARRALPAARAAGDAIADRPGRAASVAAALAAALVWTSPDRLRFVGDFLLRQGSAERAIAPASVYPQALPLDVLLHFTLPRALAPALGADAAARLVGALGAAALGALAVAFARAAGFRGPAALACAAAVACGGWLALFTGYAKAFGPLVALTVACGAFALRVAREGRGHVALGVSLALALALHRSAVALVPGVVAALALGARAEGGDGRARRWAARLVPAAALAVLAPRLATTFGGVDVTVHLAPAEARASGLVAAWLAPRRLADLANLVALIAPLIVALPAALIAWRRPPRPAPLLVLAALALPFALGAALVHPAQGIPRDWDDFAAPLAALGLMAAFVAGEAIAHAPQAAWVAVAVSVGVAAPSVQWLRHHTDLPRALARVEALATGPPVRAAGERGRMWDFLGIRHAQDERWDAAARALARAAADVPSPRVLLQLAMAEESRGDLAAAREAFRRSIARRDDDPMAWTGLASVALRLGDTTEVARAADALDRLAPGSPQARGVRAALARARAAGAAR